jgi:hypothetical protein
MAGSEWMTEKAAYGRSSVSHTSLAVYGSDGSGAGVSVGAAVSASVGTGVGVSCAAGAVVTVETDSAGFSGTVVATGTEDSGAGEITESDIVSVFFDPHEESRKQADKARTSFVKFFLYISSPFLLKFSMMKLPEAQRAANFCGVIVNESAGLVRHVPYFITDVTDLSL